MGRKPSNISSLAISDFKIFRYTRYIDF